MEYKDTKKVFKVEVIESERGWGQKLDSLKFFDTKEEAEGWADKFNEPNTASTAPDWYMQANLCGWITVPVMKE